MCRLLKIQTTRPVETKGRRSGPGFTNLTWFASCFEMLRPMRSGGRYLIQHSAGSGKSNSIAWLAHQLIGIEKQGEPVLDSVIVVTDRLVLDRQITETIKQFAQVGSVVGHADGVR